VLAGRVQAHGSDVSQWTRQQLINAAGVVTGLSWTEIASLKLHDIESISAVGNNGKWSSTQVYHQLASHSVKLFLLSDVFWPALVSGVFTGGRWRDPPALTINFWIIFALFL